MGHKFKCDITEWAFKMECHYFGKYGQCLNFITVLATCFESP